MQSLQEQIIWASRAMLARGLVAGTTGNVSARHGSGMLITPTRVHPDDLVPEAIVEMSLDGAGEPARSATRPSLEWRLHGAVYSARGDVSAIVHTHSPYATARSFDPAPLIVQTQERVYLGLEQINVAAGLPAGSDGLAAATVEALGDGFAVLLSRHGAVAVGASPRDALELATTVEHQAQIEQLILRRDIGSAPGSQRA